MNNENPEEIVKKAVLERLDQWLKWDIVVDYDDVSNLGRNMNLYTGRWFMHSKEGKRDIIAWFKVGTILWTYLIECKAPDGGEWLVSQQNYAKKFEGLDNCIYEVVSDAKQVNITLEKITNRSEIILQKCNEIMNNNYSNNSQQLKLFD